MQDGSIGCSIMSRVRRKALITFIDKPESMKELKESNKFLETKPYRVDTVFGHVAILDYKMALNQVKLSFFIFSSC